jgi:hypothetical protein
VDATKPEQDHFIDLLSAFFLERFNDEQIAPTLSLVLLCALIAFLASPVMRTVAPNGVAREASRDDRLALNFVENRKLAYSGGSLFAGD